MIDKQLFKVKACLNFLIYWAELGELNESSWSMEISSLEIFVPTLSYKSVIVLESHLFSETINSWLVMVWLAVARLLSLLDFFPSWLQDVIVSVFYISMMRSIIGSFSRLIRRYRRYKLKYRTLINIHFKHKWKNSRTPKFSSYDQSHLMHWLLRWTSLKFTITYFYH